MHDAARTTAIILCVITVGLTLAFVTSTSSLAMPSTPGIASIGRLQELTPTPTAADASVAGSTNGIFWMGVVITVIVLSPILANRMFWQRHSS